MKLARNVLFGLVVAGMVVFLSGVSFAQKAVTERKDSSAWKVKHEAKMKILQDSAAALRVTNPDLAEKLSALVTKEKTESREKMESKKEMVKDETGMKAKHEARVKLFQDAAAALKQSHPDLAKDLEAMTMVKHKTEMQGMAGEKKEKEEVGEKVEPKSEKSETK